MPGRAGATGGEIMVSDAAMPCVSEPLLLAAVVLWLRGVDVPGVEVPEGAFAEALSTMVDWEEEREKVLARGARCVSLSSVQVSIPYPRGTRQLEDRQGKWRDLLFVSFHDMMPVCYVLRVWMRYVHPIQTVTTCITVCSLR